MVGYLWTTILEEFDREMDKDIVNILNEIKCATRLAKLCTQGTDALFFMSPTLVTKAGSNKYPTSFSASKC